MRPRHKKILTFIAPVLLIVLFLMPTQAAYAVAWPFQGLVDWLTETIYTILVGFGSIFLVVGGTLLDLTVSWFIVEMGDWFTGDGANITPSVVAGWTLIRDLLNLGFIFGLVWIGIKTILNSEDSGTRRALGYLIAAAILINFSLLITQVIIDFSNLLAAQIYAQLEAAGGGGGDGFLMPITSAFLNSLGLTSLLGGNAGALSGSFFKAVLVGMMVMVFFSVAGLIFALGAITVITRFIALTLYMVFSPLMFIGWILPQFQSLASKWWTGFFKYVWFGPIFVFLIYLSAAITQDISASLGIGGFADFADDAEFDGGMVQTILLFIFAMGLLYASLKVSDKMSISGSKLTMRLAGAGTAGVSGMIVRSTAGRLANTYAESERAQERARQGGLSGAVARRQLRLADATRNASFDARNTGALKNAGLGTGQSGGYTGRQKAISKREQEIAKLASSADSTQVFKDNGLDAFHGTLEENAKKQDEKRMLLSTTTDPQKRKDLVAEIKGLDDSRKEMMKSAEGKRYKEVKGNMKATLQNEYAANLASRGEHLSPVSKLAYRSFVRSKAENKAAAGSIRKELKEGSKDQDKQNQREKEHKELLEVLKAQNKKGDGNEVVKVSTKQETKEGVEYRNVTTADGRTEKKTEGGLILPS
jgi:hypothetical protein